MNAEATEAEQKTMSKTDAEPAIAVEGALDNTEKEARRTIAGGACIEMPAKMASTVDTGQVVTTVAAGKTE